MTQLNHAAHNQRAQHPILGTFAPLCLLLLCSPQQGKEPADRGVGPGNMLNRHYGVLLRGKLKRNLEICKNGWVWKS